MELPDGKRMILIEKKGKDLWRGGYKTLHEAIEMDAAGIGADRFLLNRAMNSHEVELVMFVVEDLRKVFMARMADFFDGEKARTRTHWDGSAHLVLGYHHFSEKYLGPDLKRKRKRASA